MFKTVIFLFFLMSGIAHSQVEFEKFTVLGKTTFRFWGLAVYEATLYSKGQSEIYQDDLVLKLEYQLDLSGRKIGSRTIDELKFIGVQADQAEQERSFYESIFPDVKSGESILAYYQPQKGVSLWFNNQKHLADIKDLTKAKNFLDIWLSNKSSAQENRKKLLNIKER